MCAWWCSAFDKHMWVSVGGGGCLFFTVPFGELCFHFATSSYHVSLQLSCRSSTMDPQDPQEIIAEKVPETVPEANHATEYAFAPAEKLELTEKCHHYEHKSEVPWDIAK